MPDLLLSFGCIILAGVGVRRLSLGLDAGTLRQAINASVFNIFLPALCIKIVYNAALDSETLLVPATAWITTISGLLISVAVYSLTQRMLRITPAEKGVLVLAAAFGNVMYLGLPVLTGLYGYEAAKYALFYDLLATTPLVWLAGASLASRYGEGKEFRIGESLKTLASLPPVWGIVGGMLLKFAHVPLPAFVLKALGMFGDLVVPLMIFTIGLALTLPGVKHAYAIVPAVLIKLLVVPLISGATAFLLGIKGTALASCLIEGAMPAMVLTLVMASRFKLDESLAAFVIVVTTVISFVTLPLTIHLAGLLIR